MEIFGNVPINLDSEEILQRLHARGNRQIEETVAELIESVCQIAKPKTVYKVCYVGNRNQDSLDIDGVEFTSRVLSVNLDKIEAVFPYITTCGRELDSLTITPQNYLKFYCLDIIKQAVLRTAGEWLRDYIEKKHAIPQLSRMGPGRLVDWPLQQQKELFSLFGNVEELIGVRLTKDFLMVPLKSASGIFFPTDVIFETCQLCPMIKCPGRRAPYDPEAEKNYMNKTRPQGNVQAFVCKLQLSEIQPVQVDC